MDKADIERVARALCRQHGIQFMSAEGIDGYVQMYWQDHVDDARVAMAETRRIDAEALETALSRGDVSNSAWDAANWLKGRADESRP